jgi:23S rRNA-/tRNA-specific pseudouridylate synthase
MERIVETRVKAEDAGIGILDWLVLRFAYCSRAEWEGFLASGSLTVNGGKAEPGRPLAAGDLVAFAPPDIEEPPVDDRYGVAYEDGDFLVVSKPPLLPCHPGGRFFAHTLWYLLKRDFGTVHLVSRLDRETSGLLLVARTPRAMRHAEASRRGGSIRKRYLAAVHGDFPGSLDARGWLEADTSSLIRKKRRFVPAVGPGAGSAGAQGSAADIEPGGRRGGAGSESCETRFTLRDRQAGFSLVEAEPVTGRTHQIRATLRSLGYPVVGDKMYGLDEGFFLRFLADGLSSADLAALILPFQALHSERLEFPDLDGKTLSLSAPPPWSFPPADEKR